MARKAVPRSSSSLFDGPVTVPRDLPPGIQNLFLPKLVAEAAHNAQIEAYDERRSAAFDLFRSWAHKGRSGELSNLGEAQLEQDFAAGLLAALGYLTQGMAAVGQSWSAQPKWAFPNVGIADVALGRFETDAQGKLAAQVLAVVELKGPKVDLDKPDFQRKRSPVQQAWEYLTATDSARWAIVTNFVEFRLYHRDRGRNQTHRVLLDDLDEPEAFARFFAIFHADSLLTDAKLARHAARLLHDTIAKQETVGDELYDLYNDRRAELVKLLQVRHAADRDTAIRTAQKLLDRVLFLAFAEDRKLLDHDRVLEATHRMKVPMRSAWQNFQGLFRACDQGHRRSGIPAFDGGLFRLDPILDDPDFELGDEWPQLFETLGGFDFRDEVTEEVLGHIFEQSITDLERLRAQGPDAFQAERAERKAPGRRKREGAFYTGRAIVQYLVASALDPTWNEVRAEVGASHGLDPESAGPPTAFTRDLLARLDALTVCDPACGSGAFLIAVYQWFETHRMSLLEDLAAADPDAPECSGGRDDWRGRTARQVLAKNLHGVDLNAEAVEIARLSLWIRTARRDQPLTDLDHNIVEGNSVVDDSAVDPKGFAWPERFPEVFARGGFDAVIGNPPYVRQEWLGEPLKADLARRFQAYHGMADLYVYFYERGLQVLRPGGRLAFVVTNKWMKAGYAEPLRKLFADAAWVEQVIDFGHAKQFFPDADVFPCFLVVRRPTEAGPPPDEARVCVIPRDVVRVDELPAQVATAGIAVERSRFTSESWNLEPQAVGDLMAKIRARGVPLSEYAGVKPLMGIKTGHNEAFLIDTPTRDALIQADHKCAEIIRPYLRGQDIDRWAPNWAGLWMIALKSSGDHPWPWAASGDEAETMFAATYPSLYKHLKRFEPALRERQDHGRYWWELRSCAYWDMFDGPKVLYQDITWTSTFCFDDQGTLSNNTVYFLPGSAPWIIGYLNSPLGWWFSWRAAQHGKDEALRLFTTFMESFPVPTADDGTQRELQEAVNLLLTTSREHHEQRATLLDWLRIEYEVSAPSQKLRNPTELDPDGFVTEVRKARGKSKPLSSAGLKQLREEYDRTIEPARQRAAEALTLERRVNDLVNAAYGLTPEEVQLMWDTAPPRMPIPRPDRP